MSDMWSHSHDWDNGYAVGHKDGYQQGRADAIDEYFKAICRDNLITNENNLIIASIIAEQIKEQTNDNT